MGSDQSSWLHSCFHPIHGTPVISTDKGHWGENHSSLLELSQRASTCGNLWLDFSEAHWDCSCKHPDSRRAFELTALFRGDGQHRPWISSGCLSSPPSSSSVVAGYMWKRRDSVFDAFLILPSNMSQAHLLRVKGQGYWTSCWSLVIE